MPFSKKQLLRVIRLIDLLKADRFPNCASFAKELCRADVDENLNVACSPKTVYRDIRMLRDDFRAPIRFDADHNGYYLADRNWDLPGGLAWDKIVDAPECPDDCPVRGVVIRCDRVLTRYVRRHPLHPRQRIVPLSGGACELHIDRIRQSILIAWVIHFCGKATVNAPVEVRQRILSLSRILAEGHKDLMNAERGDE